MRYVALGDTFTMGVSVGRAESWPDQLVARLARRAEGSAPLELVANLAGEGQTSADLIRDQLPMLNELDPELVTVQVGAGDVIQGTPENAYADNVATILDELLGRLPANRILTVATPDFTAGQRAGALGDPVHESAAVARFNEILAEAGAARGIAHVAEPYALSREALEDRSLLADDGLHPSGAQYARWVDAIAPAVERLLR